MLDIKRIPPGAGIGLVLTAAFVFCALFAPWIAPFDNGATVGDVWEPMSSAHVLGTDNLGRDLLSRMIYGARITIFIAVLATALSFSLGASLGFAAPAQAWGDHWVVDIMTFAECNARGNNGVALGHWDHFHCGRFGTSNAYVLRASTICPSCRTADEATPAITPEVDAMDSASN